MKKKPPIHAPPIAVGVARSEPEFPDRASLSRQVPVPVPVSRDFTLRSNVHRHPAALVTHAQPSSQGGRAKAALGVSRGERL